MWRTDNAASYLFSTGKTIPQKKIKDRHLKKKYQEAITEIRNNPDIGRFKTGDLAGIRGFDIKHDGVYYEIAYRVTVNAQGNVVVMAGTRENFYEVLKKYYKLVK